MTIDERLEKLTERHEALTQSVELIAMEMRQHTAANERLNERLTVADERTSRKIEIVVDAIRDLVGVVRSHEHRISDLESPI